MNSKTQLIDTDQGIKVWLQFIGAMIFIMIILGGVTRLTGSGLSIVEWKPIMGVIPPLNQTDWKDAFGKYQSYPQYRLLNQGMTLDGFKWIFFWEYLHRLWGRLIGFVFFVPLLIYWFRGSISKQLKPKLILLLFMGGLQGLVGWVMVKSGLIDIPNVSHFRLAIHFLLALGLLSLIYWNYLELCKTSSSDNASTGQIKVFKFFVFFLVLQLTWGAFTAGLKAGLGYNTFPEMNGEWMPSHIFTLTPFYLNFIAHAPAVQFTHRLLGWTLFGFSVYFLINSCKFKLFKWLGFAISFQFILGILTLIFYVPILLATAHQATATLIVCLTVKTAHKIKGPLSKKEQAFL